MGVTFYKSYVSNFSEHFDDRDVADLESCWTWCADANQKPELEISFVFCSMEYNPAQ
jgi:hypothetical protein